MNIHCSIGDNLKKKGNKMSAEMPIKRKLRDTSASYVTDLGKMRNNAYRDGVIEGYNQCHDDFLAYHLKKMEEKEIK